MTDRSGTIRHPASRPHRYAHGRAEQRSTLRQPWSVVTRRREGLLRYARARGVVSLAIHYAPWGHRLMLRLPPYNDASHFLDQADVALDVDASAPGRLQIVRIAGMAVAIPVTELPEEIDPAPEPLSQEQTTSAVIIVPESVTWLPVVDDVRYPPLPGPSGRFPATYVD